MALLIISKDGKDILHYPLKKKLVSMGRSAQCDVVLPDPDISSLHANILCAQEGDCRLIDPGSTNGTFVAGERVAEHLLKDGDDIRIGRYRISYLLHDPLDDTTITLPDEDFIGKSQALLTEIKDARLLPVLEHTQNLEAGQLLRQSLEDLDVTLGSAQRAHDQLKILLHMAELINSAKGFDSVLTAILNSALSATGMECGAIVLYNAEKALETVVSVGMQKEAALSYSVVHRALETDAPVVLSDIDEAQDLRSAQSVVAQNIKATICMSLKSRTSKLLGVLYMDSRLAAVNKNNIGQDFLRMFSIFAATAIQTRQMAQRDKEISEQLAAAREREKYQEQLKELEQENRRLAKKTRTGAFGNLLGSSGAMEKLFSFIEKVAPTDVTVLITGETGTGKGVVAKAIHDHSERKAKEFVTIDCASIPSELLESELFGYEKGAFTGAVAQKKGRIEAAEGGTLFLDEIGDMSLSLQSKLLRFLQEKSFERVGGNRTLTINVRVVAATNKDLKRAVSERMFREDLYYRLCGVSLHMPALRERGEDAYILANAFLTEVRDGNNLPIKGFTPEAKNAILHYSWNGNIRQLKNVIQRAAILCNGEYIGADDLGLDLVSAPTGMTLKDVREEAERKIIQQYLLMTKGNLSKTARSLDIDRGTLREYMKKYGIEEIPE